MSKISDDRIIDLFAKIADGQYNKSKLEKLTNISRRRIGVFICQLAVKGYKPSDVANFTEEQFEAVFHRSGGRKIFIEPDLALCYKFMHPKGVYKKHLMPTLAQAWLEMYVKPCFKVEPKLFNLNSLRFDYLPEGCMSFSTFKVRYKKYEESIKTKYSGLSNTASIGETAPGLIEEIDGVGNKLLWIDCDGNQQQARAFVAVLKFSGLMFIYACPKATTEDWARFIIASFKYFGGVPYCIKADNDVALTTRKLVTTYAGKSYYDIQPNPTMRYIANAYDSDFILTNTYRCREKGLVERCVKTAESLIEQSLELKNGRFNSLKEVNDVLTKLSEEHNNKINSSDYTHRSYFEEFERAHLKPLPMVENMLDTVKKAIVSSRSYVRFLGNDYAVPEELIGQTVYCMEIPGNKFNILDFLNLKVIATYTIDRKPHPSIKKHKSKELMSAAELYVSRGLDDFLKQAAIECPLLKDELQGLYKHIYANIELNDVDKTELCNRILKICVDHSTRYQEFRMAINFILDSKIDKAEKLLNIIKQVIIGEATTHTFTKREELKKQLQLAGFNSNQSKNVRSKEYFMQKFANAEEVNND